MATLAALHHHGRMSEETLRQLRDRTRINRVSLSALRSQPEPGSADVKLVAADLEKVIAAMDFALAEGSADTEADLA